MVRISLNNLDSGNIYVKLNQNYINGLLSLIKKSNTILPEKIEQQLYRIKRGHKVSMKFLKEFSLNMDIPIQEIEKNISKITSIKCTEVGINNPKIPMNFNSVEGARLIAAIMGDGELNSQLNVRYNNQNKELIYLVLKAAKKIFGNIDHKIYLRKDKTYNLHFPKIIGLIMITLGIKPGYKTMTNYPIPNYLFSSNDKVKAMFIKQFYNDEGNVRLKDRRVQIKQTTTIKVSKEEAKANPERYAAKSLIGIKQLLSDFGIGAKLSLGAYREGKADWELTFYRIENLKKFQSQIGFDVQKKNEYLDRAIKSYKFPSAARNGKIEFAFTKAKEVQKENGYITKYLMAKKCERSLKTATYYLVELKKKGLIHCIEKPRNKLGHPKPQKYKIISL